MPGYEYRSGNYLNYIFSQELVMKENRFRTEAIAQETLPTFKQARLGLPDPYWDGHEDAICCYWKVWELAFANLRQASPENGFIANYIDSAFNANLFGWDTVFIERFGRYAARIFDFQRSLDNFYQRQHDDGYICRELLPIPGGERFHPHDPASIGPNLLAWCEWEHFLNTGDRDRLAAVFPVILAYHRWLRRNRTWQDGSYWHCGLSSGMDNQNRIGSDCLDEIRVSHGWLSWIDATAQALLSARRLVDMAKEVGRLDEVAEELAETDHLCAWINYYAWDHKTGYYYDVSRDGHTTGYKSIAAYWTLLAGAVLPERRGRLVKWLGDPNTFWRPHPVPSIAKGTPGYGLKGRYWLGGVFPPATYMVLLGLTAVGEDELAYKVACKHHAGVVEVFKETGTVWEFYAPEHICKGWRHDRRPAKKDFAGWAGLGPVAVLFEYCFGLRPDVPENRLVWDVRETNAFGVKCYPFGREGLIDLHCAARSSPYEKPAIEIYPNCELELELRWPGGAETLTIPAGDQTA